MKPLESDKDARAIFGLSESFTQAELRKRRAAMLKQVHPDKG